MALTWVAEPALFYASLPEVTAVGLGGSRSRGQDDASSDLDLYIFTTSDLADALDDLLREAGALP